MKLYRKLYTVCLLLALTLLPFVGVRGQATDNEVMRQLDDWQKKVDEYYSQHDVEALYPACDTLMALAEKHHQSKIFYDVASTKSLSYLRETNISAAYDVCEMAMRKAFQEKDEMGIFISRIMLARFYNTCKLNLRAIQECRKAAEIEKGLPDHHFGTSLYLGVLSCMDNEYWQEGRKLLDDFFPLVTRQRDRVSILPKAMFIDFWLKDDARFQADRKEYEELLNGNEKYVRESDKVTLAVIDLYKGGKINEALKLAEQIEVPLRFSFKQLFFFESQQKDSLLSVMHDRNIFFDQRAQAIYDSDVRKFELELDNNQLRQDNADLEKTATDLQSDIKTISLISFAVVLLLCLVGGLIYVNAERKRLKAIRERNVLLERTSALKSMFVQNMSHEVRTPLNAILGFSQLLSCQELADTLTPQEKEEYFNIISSSTEMLTTLLNDILDLGDMESGKYRINKSKVCVNEICQKAISTVRHRIPDYLSMEFQSEFADTDLVFTDPSRVQQILVNFLTNAIKHTDEGGITLSVSRLGQDQIRFTVTDTGEGVPADKAEAIFERFEKLNTTREATGLGLPICRSLATCLEGKVYLDTTYSGPGSRFCFEQKL